MFIVCNKKMNIASKCTIRKFIIVRIRYYQVQVKMNIYFFYIREQCKCTDNQFSSFFRKDICYLFFIFEENIIADI
jgi:hypothetical protein